MSQVLAVADLQMAIGIVVEVTLEMPEMVGDAVVVVRVADKDELAAAGQRVEEGVVDQVHALLLIQPAHVRDDGAGAVAEPEPVPEHLLVLTLARDVVDRVMGRQVRVGLRVPGVVIDAVENPAELVLALLEGAAEPGGAVIEERFASVVGGYRGHEVGVKYAALHRVQPAVAEVIAQPVGVEEVVRPAQAGGPEQPLVAGALMAEVVDGIADPLVWHGLAVLLIQ